MYYWSQSFHVGPLTCVQNDVYSLCESPGELAQLRPETENELDPILLSFLQAINTLMQAKNNRQVRAVNDNDQD